MNVTQDIKILMTQAVDLHKKGDLLAACQLYRDVLSNDPEHVDALHLLGVIALQQKKYAEAKDYIDQAINLYPHNPHYYSNRGLIFQALGLLKNHLCESVVPCCKMKPLHQYYVKEVLFECK